MWNLSSVHGFVMPYQTLECLAPRQSASLITLFWTAFGGHGQLFVAP